MSAYRDALAKIAGRVLPMSDAEEEATHEQVRHALANNPAVVIHAASAEKARKIYSESFGLTIASTYGSALRRATPAEMAELETGDDDPDDLDYARRTGLIADKSISQLRAELARSNLIALSVPATVYHGHGSGGEIWAGLMAVGAGCPAFESADRSTVTMLFRAPPLGAGQPVPEVRSFELDVSLSGLEKIRPSAGSGNLVPLPHRDVLERWIRLHANEPPQWPAELNALLVAGEANVTEQMIADWLETNFRKAKRGEHTTREATYALFLAANGMLPGDLDVKVFGQAVRLASCFSAARHSEGYRWMVARKDPGKPLTSLRGVSAETLSPVDLADFKAYRASRELHPTRVRARAEQAARERQLREQQEQIARVYGSQEVVNFLRAEKYHAYHEQAEARRSQSSGQYGEQFVALRFLPGGMFTNGGPAKYADPSWWVDGPGLDPAARYRRIVQRVIEGKQPT